MGLSDLPIQPFFIERFRNHIASRRVSASYIFVGTESRGASILAKAFAKMLNCEKQDSDFCGVCHSCRMIEAQTHPDVKVYDPGDARFGIGLARQVQQESMESNYDARYRVNILKNAHSMTIEAQNALLKLLEDGKPNCTNVLLSESLDEILPTIQSRSIVLRLPPLPAGPSAALLVEKGLAEEIAKKESESFLGDISLSAWMAENTEKTEQLLQIMTSFGEGTVLPLLTVLEDDENLEYILHLVREVLHRAVLLKHGIHIDGAFLEKAVPKIANMPQERLQTIERALAETERLWKTQSKKTTLAQAMFLRAWTSLA